MKFGLLSADEPKRKDFKEIPVAKEPSAEPISPGGPEPGFGNENRFRDGGEDPVKKR